MHTTNLAVATATVVASCIGQAEAQVAELALPSTHRAYMKAWGGDPDSWDLLIGFVPLVPNTCTGSVTYVAASKGCWPADEYYEGTCYTFSHDTTANETVDFYQDYQDTSYSTACTSDLSSFLDDLFSDQPYLRIDYFNDTDCGELDVANIMIADGACHPRYVTVNDSTTESMTESRLAIIDESGGASFKKFASDDCSGDPTEDFAFSKKQLKSHECVDSVEAHVASSGLSAGAIAGIVIGVVAFLALVAGAVWWYRRKMKSDELARKLDVDNASTLEADTLHAADNKANAYRAT
jgi:hypothetical protein